jgi:hypothetical protein
LARRTRILSTAFPYLNRELTDLPAEKWKDLPELEGYYLISNFGRVKRESFEVMRKNGTIKLLRPKIIRLELQRTPNHTIGDEVYFLKVRIGHIGIIYRYSIARIVYYSFIRKFRLSDKNKVVLPIDGNGKNIVLQNLALVDIRRKQQRIFERKRLKREFLRAYDEFTQTRAEQSTNPYCRQISQYTRDGKKVKTYPSINTAAKVIGIGNAGIHAALQERQVSSGGFIWRYGRKKRVAVQAFITKRKERYKKLVGQKLSQYSAQGKRIATWLTISDAAKSTGFHPGDLSNAIQGKQRSAGGWIWKKGWGKKQIDLSQYDFGESWRAKRRWKKVKQYSLHGKFIRYFPSIKAAAAHMHCVSPTISSALKSKSGFSGGFRWKLA